MITKELEKHCGVYREEDHPEDESSLYCDPQGLVQVVGVSTWAARNMDTPLEEHVEFVAGDGIKGEEYEKENRTKSHHYSGA